MARQICYPRWGAGWLMLLGLAFGLTSNPASAQETALALRGATIETAGKAGRIEKGTLILRGGKIEAVGADVKIPEDAHILDVSGKTILPGMIDPFREVNIAGATPDAAPRTIVIGRRGFAPGGRGNYFGRTRHSQWPDDPFARRESGSGPRPSGRGWKTGAREKIDLHRAEQAAGLRLLAQG